MLAAIMQRLRGGADAAPESLPLPPELVQGITYATIAARPGADPESGDSRVLVQSAALGGAFYWEGTKPAAERIARLWPDLGPTGARRAARLLADTVAARMRADFRGDRGRRGWVWDLGR